MNEDRVKLSCKGCEYALSRGRDEDDLMHDEGCVFYKPEQVKVDWIEIKRLRHIEGSLSQAK